MAAGGAKPLRPSIEQTVVWYRREALRARTAAAAASPELEVRLQDVDYDNFATVYAALARGTDRDSRPLPVGPGTLTQVVSAIVVLHSGSDSQATRAAPSRPMRIREIYFEGGKKSRERFVRKEPLVIPYRVSPASGLGYIVALSAENEEAAGFASDESTIIRVKARVSFPLRLAGVAEAAQGTPLLWRVDLTVTRQIMGNDADSALQQIVGQMFRGTPVMRADTLLSSLGLDGDPSKRALYRYEIEAEFVGPPEVSDFIRPADVTAAADTILGLVDPANVREASFQAIIYRVAQHLVQAPAYLERFKHELGLKRLLPQVQALTRTEYKTLYPPVGLYLTDKAEGVRALAVVQSGKGAIVASTLFDGFKPDPHADPAAVSGVKAGDTVLDGELIVGPGDGLAFYAFDAIAVAGEQISADGFEKRLGRIGEGVAILRAAGIPAAAKGFEHITSAATADLDRVIKGVHGAKRPYRVDGLIFVEPGKPYKETASYKWKSAHDNTIDFLARRPPGSVLGKQPFIDRPGHRLHFLFVGANTQILSALGVSRCPGYSELFPSAGRGGHGPQSYVPAQFSPSDSPFAYLYQHPEGLEPVDGKIVELRCAGGCEAAGGGGPLANWEFVRTREDRARELATGQHFGNDLQTAESVWLNYLDPFPIDQLVNGPGLYFQNEKSTLYSAQTAVISFVKSRRISELQGVGWVIDLGAGKGQDLGRYLSAKVGHLLAVDRDRAGLGELVRRKYSHARHAAVRKENDSHAHKVRSPVGTIVHVLAADVTDPYSSLLAKFETLGLQRFGADAIVCNLAIHYMLKDLDALRNFIALARGSLKLGGQVILTILRGDLVHRLFCANKTPVGGTWDVFETPHNAAEPQDSPQIRKYSLRRDYSSSELEDTGQQVGVLLPFSNGDYYTESLVNPRAVSREFAARGFKQTAFTSVADSFDAFAEHNRAVSAGLTPGDKQYLALYGELVFVREK